MLLNIAKVFICTGVSKCSSKNSVILNLVYIHRESCVAESQLKLSPLTFKLHKFTSPIAAICTYVNSVNVMQLSFSELQEQLDVLMGEIEAFVSSSECERMSKDNIVVGCACLALYVADGGWYRAEILNVDDKIKVNFVDYGNEELIDIDNLRCITEHFVQLPKASITCTLADVDADDLNKVDAVKYLEEIVMISEGLSVEVTEKLLDGGIKAYVTMSGVEDTVNDTLYFN